MRSPKRPIVVWIALAYIAIGLITNLLFLYSRADQLLRLEADNIVFLLLTFATLGLLILTYDAIVRRKMTGQRLAILSFIILGAFAIYNLLVLVQWPQDGPGTGQLFIAKILVIGRLVLSFFLAICFAVSKSIDRYFAEGHVSEPPPPESFDQ